MRDILLVLILLFSQPLLAGYYELGFSGSYRKLNLPSEGEQESFDSTVSYTASLAYYFAEMAATEINYTKGQSERFVAGQTADSRTTYDFSLIGFDLILTFAKRQDPFVPYLKAGVAYFYEKQVTYDFLDGTTGAPLDSNTIPLDRTFVPSVGFGLKIRFTRTMSFKVGVESWTAESLNSDPQWDVAGRAGISWFL